jgi:transcriptional regulator with XRE-family HTH domain
MEEQERLILKMLSALMHERRLSQRALGEQLAAITGTPWSQQKVWKVLNGKIELTVDMLLKLCEAFDMGLVELLMKAQALKPMPAAVADYLKGLPHYLVVIVKPVKEDPKETIETTSASREYSAD